MDSLVRVSQRPSRLLHRLGKSKEPPVGYRKISKPESLRRMQLLVGLVADGKVPLDENSVEAIKAVLQHHYDKKLGRR